MTTSQGRAKSGSLVFKLFNLLIVLFFAGVGVVAFFPRLTIPTSSNAPALLVGDMVMLRPAKGLVTTLPWIGPTFFPTPRRGDLMAFKMPNSELINIARVVGIGGDSVELRQGQLFLNGKAVPRRPLPDFQLESGQAAIKRFEETLPDGGSYETLDQRPDFAFDTTMAVTVPAGHYFVLGDHRDNVADSRDPQSGIGFVPADNMVGKALLVPYSAASGWSAWRWVR